MSASCERRRGKSSSGFWAEGPRRINANSMSRVIILSALAFAALIQAAHSESSSSNSTTNQAHKSNESSVSNDGNQNGLHQVKWPQTNHTEQANTSQQLKLNKAPNADQSKLPDAVPAGSSQASPSRESSGPSNSTTSSPLQQSRQSATLDQERQSSEQHSHWTRGGGGSSASNDLAASPSSVSSLQLDAGASKQVQQQPKRSSGSAQANRWTHFGARLRPLASGPQQQADHYHEAASSSKATAERSARPAQSNFAPPSSSARNQLALTGNSVEGPASNQEDSDEDEDDLDSEAILYKLMQQSNFLMNPNFQDQPQRQPISSANSSPGSNQQQQQPAAATFSPQSNNDEEVAKSKRVIKLLKSYSHIHQVDDTDDQIRGAYTRYPKPSGQATSIRQRPIGGQQQHIFISSIPVTTSQTRATARVYANNDEEDDGQYRTPRPVAGRPSGHDDEGAAAAESGSASNSNGPEQDEDDFECPNNGIFADVASGCQAYHVCQSASQVQQRFQCPLGTLFNDIILTCDFAHNVLCGKKPGELGNAAFPAPSANQQQQSPEQPQTTRYRSQASTGGSSGQQQRPASNGPRHLVIGSPYNLHNAQQRPAQSQPPALSAYPPVKPLSNSIAPSGPNDSNNNGDEDDENEPDEPLVPATLPPRSNSSPPPNFQSAHSSQAATPTNFSPAAQEPAIRTQQPVYKSTYQQRHRQTPARTPSQQQQQQQQRPRYQPDPEASSTPASNFEASAAPPTFVELNQHRPKSFSQHDSTTAQTPTGSQANDMQSFSLVINHMAPAVLPNQPTATTGINYNQLPNAQQEPTRAGVSAGQRSPVQSQRVATAVQQRGNQQVAAQPANTNPRTQWVGAAAAPLSSAQQPKQPQQQQQPVQRLAPRRNLQKAALPSSQRFRTEPVATSSVANARQASRYGQPSTTVTSQAQLLRVASAVANTTPASYEETTPAASQSAVSHQHSQQQQPLISFPGNKNDNSEAAAAAAADLTAQEIAIRQQQAAQQQQQPRFSRDQSAPNEDVLNDGMFLIIRHNARAPPVQVVGATQAVASVAAPAPAAASDVNVAHKFGGVERVLAPSRGVPVKQRTHRVYGLLQPMEPPAPQAHDHQHKQQLAGQQQQQPLYAANSDQLVPSASSLPAASNAETTAKQQQQLSTTSTTTPSSSQTPPTGVRVKGQKRQTPPNKSAQKQQPRAIRVAKRIKAVATPPKPSHLTNSTTSVANKAISSKLAENVAPTSV